jgi:hypothetical protein
MGRPSMKIRERDYIRIGAKVKKAAGRNGIDRGVGLVYNDSLSAVSNPHMLYKPRKRRHM